MLLVEGFSFFGDFAKGLRLLIHPVLGFLRWFGDQEPGGLFALLFGKLLAIKPQASTGRGWMLQKDSERYFGADDVSLCGVLVSD